MKGKYGGPISIDDLFQALWQDRQFFRQHNITHVCDAVFFFTPCDLYGNPVVIRHHGERIGGYISAGGYHCAASQYDDSRLEPETTIMGPTPEC